MIPGVSTVVSPKKETNKESEDVKGNGECPSKHAASDILRPIAPKPVTIVCVPDLPNIRETELENTKKTEAKHTIKEEGSLKVLNVGSTVKYEKEKDEDIVTLKKIIPTGRSPPKIAKKKPRQIRDLEKTLNCLLSDNQHVKDEKAFAFAQSYFLKVTERLHGKDDPTYTEFMKTMNDFGVTIFDAVELYKKITKIFDKYPDLAEEFLAFLLPEQAMQCGKFMEYIMLTKMSSFCRKLELYYSKQPYHLHKIYSSLSTLASNNKATVDDLKNTILPLLRHNSLLVNMFLELMPTEAPHASSLTNFETMDFKTVDINNPKQEDWFETVEVPPPAEDLYGGEGCTCPCHSLSEGISRRRSAHCMSCGTKFINGRVYFHCGNMLRPAKVCFREMRAKAIERLSVKNVKSRQNKNQGQTNNNKKNNPTKGDATSNVLGSCNKLSPTKPKKPSKGKIPNENQKKSNKASSPKTPHNKKLSNEKKIANPPRKRIKSLNSKMSPDSSAKSDEALSKKGLSPTGKASSKTDTKSSGKYGSQVTSEQNGKSYRAPRSASQNSQGKIANDTNQKSYRKTSAKAGGSKETTLEIHKNKTEGLISKNKGINSKIDHSRKAVSKISPVHKRGKCEIQSTTTGTTGGEIKSIDKNEEEQCRTIEQKMVIRHEIAEEQISLCEESEKKGDLKESSSMKMLEISSNELREEEFEIESEQSVGELSSEEDASTCLFREVTTVRESSDCLNASDDSISDECVINKPSKKRIKKDYPHCIENVPPSRECNVKKELLYSQQRTENNFSEEDSKMILDSEDLPGSSDSEMEVDVEKSCQVFEDRTSSSESEDEINASSSEKHCNGDLKEKESDKMVTAPWTRDEDKIILRTFQSLNNSECVFQTIQNELPSRSAEEVRSRFQTLMSFLQEMTSDQPSPKV